MKSCRGSTGRLCCWATAWARCWRSSWHASCAAGGTAAGLLVVAASGPPDAPHPAEPLHVLPDEEFLRRLQQRFDGIPPAVRDNPELLQLLLPMLRPTCDGRDVPMRAAAAAGRGDPGAGRHERSVRLGRPTCGLAGTHNAEVLRPASARDHFFLFRGDGPQPPEGGTGAVSPALQLFSVELPHCLPVDLFDFVLFPRSAPRLVPTLCVGTQEPAAPRQ